MSEVLYRKWRPKRFSDIVGQTPIVQTLSRAVQSSRVAHAYLFCGPRGTGKTSTARILAKSINCLSKESCNSDNPCHICRSIDEGSALDLIEIDAASNRGIDDIRDLRDKARYAPNEASHKVYIIDEAHMLTDQAFNALLKTLEEPPDQVIFILATTESHKIPATILSRCQRFDFVRITSEIICERLSKICSIEGFDVEVEALKLIAHLSGGALRDAINILEQSVISDEPPISEAKVRNLLDIGDDTVCIELTGELLEQNTKKALEIINNVANSGNDLRHLHIGLIKYLRAVLLIKSGININHGYSETIYKQLESTAAASDINSILHCLKTMTDPTLKPDSSNPLLLELAIVEAGIDYLNNNQPKMELKGGSSENKLIGSHKIKPITTTKVTDDLPKITDTQDQESVSSEKNDNTEAAKVGSPDLPPTNQISEPNQQLEHQWQSILDSLRYTKGDKFNLKALLITCTNRRIHDESITLGFSHPSHRERMEHELTIPESRKTLIDSFASALGKQYKLVLETNSVTVKSNVTDELDSPLIRMAQSKGAQIIDQTPKR